MILFFTVAYRSTARTEAKRRQTRQRIIAGAQRLVARGGYQAVSMNGVAQGAGVGVGTVYRHFPSKGELFSEVFRRASDREVKAVEAAILNGGSAPDKLARAAETFARRALAGRRLAWALIAEPVDPMVDVERLAFRREYRDIFAAVIEDGVAGGELSVQNPQLSAAAIVGAIGESLVGSLSPTAAQVDEESMVAELVRFCMRSVGIGDVRR